MSNYVEITDKDKHYLINLDIVGFIDASQIEEVPGQFMKEEYKNDKAYQAFIIIPSSFVSIKIPVYGNTIEEAKEKQMAVYTKLYNAISTKQKKIRSIEV